MNVGQRVLHADYAFGAVTAVSDGKITVHLDNGQDITTAAEGWEVAHVLSEAVIPVAELTDEQLDTELERFRTMRQMGVKKARTRAEASREPSRAAKIAELIKAAETNEEIRTMLKEVGIL